MMFSRLLVSFAVMAGAAQPPAQAAVAAPPLLLDHVGIQAENLDRSMTFYVGVLGLAEAPAPFPRAVARWVSVGGGRMLHIVGNGAMAVGHNRWDHIALACADLDGLIARLDEHGIAWTSMQAKHEIQKRPDGVQQIFFRDPDGYTIEVNDAGKSR